MTLADRFPEHFVFGAASASYQIEGAVSEGGRSPSIWDTFSHTPGRTVNGDTGDIACDHYHRYRDDVALMKQLNLQAYRFSTSWPRIMPGGTGAVNPAGMDFYDRLVDELLAAGITPMVTLEHWDMPQCLDERGGWLNRDSAQWFTEYAQATVTALGDRVSQWLTLNEPWCSSILSYAIGMHAPGHQNGEEALIAAHHLMLAHGTAVPVIRQACPNAQISISHNPSHVFGPDDPSTADLDAVRRMDNIINGVFLDPIYRGHYPEGFHDDTAYLTDHGYIHDGDLAIINAPLDFAAMNNYFPFRARAADDPLAPSALPGCRGVIESPPRPPLTDMGWEVNAHAHRLIIERVARDSQLPVVITENGSAWQDTVSEDGAIHDPQRRGYLVDHLSVIADTLADGVDIRGYFAWTLMDNFEWSFGYSKRFGLVRVDYDTQRRTIKDSGREYAEIIARHTSSAR